MIEDFFDHKCDVYHVQKQQGSPGYGLPEAATYSYGDDPDIAGLPCHFGVKSSSVIVVQQEPQNALDSRIKLTYPAGIGIRINDKIVDCGTGLAYTAELPRNIRDHHQFVYIKRVDAQRPL